MEYYLLCHGFVDEARALDPFMASLAQRGVTQSESMAESCRNWGIQFLCASTTIRSEQTADIIQKTLPAVVRWDLKELEPMSIDDMEGQVVFSSHVNRWTPAQFRYGMERTWVRLVAALARIEIYANSCSLERVALVTHADIINLCLYYWLGLDWTAYTRMDFAVEPGSSCRLSLADGHVRLQWANQRPH